MQTKATAKLTGRAADQYSTAKRAAYNPYKNSLLLDGEKTFFLTSLLGTQLLLTTSPPDYPIIKATEVVPAEMA